MLAARFLPGSNSRKSPYVCHLFITVNGLHQFIIVVMRHFCHLASPYDKFSAISKITTRDIRRRVRLCPSDDIENLESKGCKSISYRENVMVGTANPDSTIVCQHIATHTNPFHIESMHLVYRDTLIPFTFIHAHNFPILNANAAIG